MIKQAISQLTEGKNLSFSQAKAVFEEIFEQHTTPAQIAAFLIALKMKPESEDEIAAAACVIRAKAKKVSVRSGSLGATDPGEPVIDTCGTGGSGLNKFNISTATALVVSSLGVKVAKHGNRAMSSSCGSADVLEALGISLDVSPEVMESSIQRVGIGFLYAPLYHPALGRVAQIRREMGVRTIFNILGPLCNPAGANYQLLGVYRPELIMPLARVLKTIGLKAACVVCGKDVADEVSLTGPTSVALLKNKKISRLKVTAASFGLKKIRLKDIMVNSPQESAEMISAVLAGRKGAPRNMVAASAAVCFYILDKAKDFKQGARLAEQLIDKGKAKAKLAAFKQFVAQ